MHKFIVRIFVFIVLLIFVIGGTSLWWTDANSPVNSMDVSSKTFTITKGENIRTIATRLKNEGLIKNQIGFFLRIKFTGFDNKIQAGDFLLSPSMNTNSIILALTLGKMDIRVTTLEGWRVEEIALKLNQELALPEIEFLKYAKEGYMFPDTYLIPRDATSAAIVKIFEENLYRRVTPSLTENLKLNGLSFRQSIVLASLVEREGKSNSDKPIIAGILLNRLKKNWPLQVDATVQYALGYQAENKSWWKKTLDEEDKSIDSPYNTYKNVGLPPLPICNPGLLSITAVALPQKTDYMYYLHDPKGEAHYAVSFEEHNQNITKFLK